MIKIGMIVEYNPLHNGHIYLYNKIKEMYPSSLVIAIETGEFTSRGELNVFDKFTRAKLSLEAGIDLILSNPIYYSVNNASSFAYSSVYFLNNAKVEKIICGSESADITLLNAMIEIEKDPNFNNILKSHLEKGNSFKTSYLKSFESFNINFKSNDMLAFFYLKAINKINPSIKLELIKRVNNDYNDKNLNDSLIQSATALRENNTNLEKYVPNFVYKAYLDKGFRDINKLTPLFLYSSLFNKNTREDNEGLSNKLNDLRNINCYNDLIELLSSKRYSKLKIQRFSVCLLLNIKDNKELNSNYIRVLGFNENGKKHLNAIKNKTTIYTSIKNNINLEFDIELLASKIIDSIYSSNLFTSEIKGPIKK